MFPNIFQPNNTKTVFLSSTPTPPVSRPLTPVEGGNAVVKDVASTTPIKGERGLSCPFEKHGCRFIGNKLQIQEHMRDDNALHITLMGEDLKPFREEIHQSTDLINQKYSSIEAVQQTGKLILHLFSPSYLWRIEDFSINYSAAKKGYAMESPEFFSHRYGYRMIASLNSMGNTKSTRDFVNISISLCPSSYDSYLIWPFTASIALTFLDQNGTNHITTKIVPENDEKSLKIWGRPEKGERNQSYEFQLKVEGLQDKGKFYKEDNIAFIAIDVEHGNAMDADEDNTFDITNA